jgi:hypothetical protein
MKRAAPEVFFDNRRYEAIVPFSYKEWLWERFGFLFMLLPCLCEWPPELTHLVITYILRASFERVVTLTGTDLVPLTDRMFLVNGLHDLKTLIRKKETENCEVARVNIHNLFCYVQPTITYPHSLQTDRELIKILELSSPTREFLSVYYAVSREDYAIGCEETEDDNLGYEEYVDEEEA